MGCPCALHVYAADRDALERAIAAGVAEVARLEGKYSRYREDSVASALARGAGSRGGVEVDPETAALLDYAATAWRESGGLFDVTSGVLRRAWDFESGRLPAQAEIAALLPLVGWDKVEWRRPRLRLLRPGMQVDFGGYVKEYAADRAAGRLRALGVRHGLVDLGGDLCAIGPHPNGRPWSVGIRDPRRPARAFATLPLERGGLATSGDYERCMIANGVRYSHVLDPRTGWPVRGLASVSVLAPHCLVAGSATTIALLRGASAGADWLDGLGLPSLRVDESGRVSGALAPLSGEWSGRSGSGDRPGRAA